MSLRRTLAAIMMSILVAYPALGSTIKSSVGDISVDKVADGFDVPWGFGFLPDGAVVLTEREGRLWRVEDGQKRQIRGVPDVVADGQGGLLDVLVPRDFSTSRELYLTFSLAQGRGAGTAVAVGVLSDDNTRLNAVRVIFEASPGATGGRHFGSRLIEANDGTLYVTLGERGDRPSAQDLARHQGSIIRINRDGTVPSGNPFNGGRSAQAEIWSYGHRNPQGLALGLDGEIWAVEHGARGGDEINRIEKGANYGWPVISYGRHYSGFKIGEGTSKPGMVQPEWYWDPSIAPSGMMIYSGKMWPEWRGHIFVGSLKFDYISRLSGATLKEVEQLSSTETGRVRDIREAPDGSIWFLSEYEGALFRLRK